MKVSLTNILSQDRQARQGAHKVLLLAPIREVVAGDLARLAARSCDPGFGDACRIIEHLMTDGGQAGWLSARLNGGAGMNDLARMASEMFGSSAPAPAAQERRRDAHTAGGG